MLFYISFGCSVGWLDIYIIYKLTPNLIETSVLPRYGLDKCGLTGLFGSGAAVKQLILLQEYSRAHRILLSF